MKLKKTTKQFILEAKSVHGSRYSYSKSVYAGSAAKVEIICPEHGSFFQSPNSHLSKKHGCPICSKEKQKQNPNGLQSWESVLARFKKAHGSKYDYSKAVYKTKSDPIEIICPEHGSFFQNPGFHYAGHACPKCGDALKGRNAISFDEFVSRARKVHGRKYQYSRKSYTGYTTPVKIKCPEHGIFRQKPFQHVYAGNGCPHCSGKAPLTSSSFKEQAKSARGSKYNYSRSSITGNNKKPVEIICAKHGSFWQSPNNHISKSQDCPECSAYYSVSKIERRVSAWIARRVRVETSVRNLIGRKELDIYCPDQNIAVEINGVYWHSEKHKASDHLLEKSRSSKAIGLKLLHFWDFEIVHRPRAVQTLLLSNLGLNEKVHARKCQIVPVSKHEASQFFNKYHLQGDIRAKFVFGLKYEGKLLACMSFGRTRFSKEADFEILRFAGKKGFTVVGGASRLFKAFVREVNPESVLTYADIRISYGALYKAMGFEYLHPSRPSYFWSNGSNRLSRYQTQKHLLPALLDNFDPDKSETLNMRSNGWYRVFDAGTLVFIWRNQC